MSTAPRKLVLAVLVCSLIIAAPICEAKRALGGSNRKSSGGGYTTRRQPTSVTKPSYNTNSGSSSGNSHADAAKLSYPNYNSQPNRPPSAGGAPSTNNQPIGWNVPNQGHAGPPPAYSASNVPGGAKTNMHEAPPVYQKPNYGAAPPSYNQATGTNYGAAPQYHQPGALPAGATYHSPNNLPAGATYYNNPSHVPGGYAAGGSYPAGGYGGGYHAPGGMPAGATYYQSPQNLPQGATFLPAGNALPPGAVMYSSPPQQTSSGLGFGSGLAAGAIGGAILGHVLTPTQTRVVEQAPAAAAAGGGSDGGHDRIIIINNGQVMNTTDANGVTVVNAGATPAPAAAAGETPVPLAPMGAVPADMPQNATNPGETPAAMAPVAAAAATPADGSPAAPANPEQPPAGGIICVPVRVNQTDPNDATKMVEVEQIACYPAPPPPPEPQVAAEAVKPVEAAAPAPAEGSAPLAPMQPITAGSSSQQLQQESTLMGDQTIKSADNAAGPKEKGSLAIFMCFLLSYLVAY